MLGRVRNEFRYWMIVETVDNWMTDKRNGFTYFGISEHKVRVAEGMAQGDTVLTYVSSRVSSFADVRRVEGSRPEKLRFGGDYSTPFPFCIRTSPLISLDEQ